MHMRRWTWYLLSAIGVALDQASKAVIQKSLAWGSSVEISPFFNIVHILNPGAAFSLLAEHSGWQRWLLSLIAIAASVLLAIMLRRERPSTEAAALALILAGALGNMIDRLLLGAVVDWLDLYWGTLHWPAFNLADVWITGGAVVLVMISFRGREEDTHSTG